MEKYIDELNDVSYELFGLSCDLVGEDVKGEIVITLLNALDKLENVISEMKGESVE